jgi:hypothetical protein
VEHEMDRPGLVGLTATFSRAGRQDNNRLSVRRPWSSGSLRFPAGIALPHAGGGARTCPEALAGRLLVL